MNATSSRRSLCGLVSLAVLFVLVPRAHAQVHTLSAGGSHTCAIDTGGGVQCWGNNASGQLGDGSFASRSIPARVKHLNSGMVAVVASSYSRSCALRSNGEVLCWGSADWRSREDGTVPPQPIPTTVPGLGPGSGVKAITLGNSHACALRNDGAVLCWGSNEYGQIGNGATGGVVSPTPVAGFGPGLGLAVAAGAQQTCAIKFDQTVYCWGNNDTGALGDGSVTSRTVPWPVSMPAGSRAIGVSAGAGYSCAVRADGAALCWGLNFGGALGNGTTMTSFVPDYALGAGVGAIEVDGYYAHTCVRTAATVYCWGRNNAGQIGDGSTTDRYSAIALPALGGGVEAITTGVDHTCARKAGGTVVCWGGNDAGQLGNGKRIQASTPQAVMFGDSIFLDGFE